MTENEKIKAGISQLKFYFNNQYIDWRYIEVKTIKKIIDNFDSFYEDDKAEKCRIINGWFYEAMSQAIQSIEELFSVLLYSKDVSLFAKKVIFYNATELMQNIKKYQITNDSIYNDFYIPKLDVENETSNNIESSIMYIKETLCKIINFYNKYYEDYCQYKHGKSVSISPNNYIDKDTGAISSFFRVGISNKHFKESQITNPFIAFPLSQEVTPFLSELSKDDNLLSYKIKPIKMNEILLISKESCKLLRLLWFNLLNKFGNSEFDFYLLFPNSDEIYGYKKK